MPWKKESGIALITALFILIVIMMLGMVFTMMMASETNTSVRESQSTKALYLAEAGIYYGQYSAGMTGSDLISLGSNPDWYSEELGEGSFSIVFRNATENSALVSSWGYIYDSSLGYSIVRELAVSLGSQ